MHNEKQELKGRRNHLASEAIMDNHPMTHDGSIMGSGSMHKSVHSKGTPFKVKVHNEKEEAKMQS